MAGTRSTNTMTEGLRKLMQEITNLKTFPDADIAWLIDLETTIIAKLREPVDKLMGEMGPEMEQMAPLGSMGDLMGGGAGGAQVPSMDGATMPGAMPGPQLPPGRGPSTAPALPNPDELRRALSPGVQGG